MSHIQVMYTLPGFLPSPIHPRKLSTQDQREFFEDDPPHTQEVLREVARLATFPAVGGYEFFNIEIGGNNFLVYLLTSNF